MIDLADERDRHFFANMVAGRIYNVHPDHVDIGVVHGVVMKQLELASRMTLTRDESNFIHVHTEPGTPEQEAADDEMRRKIAEILDAVPEEEKVE